MKAKDLLEYETIRYAMKGLAKQTKYNYLEKLVKFFEDMQMTPDEVIAQRRKDLKSDDARIDFRWEDNVKNWYHPIFDDYEKRGLSTWTAYDFAKAAMSFFSRNRYRLRFKRGEIKTPYRRAKRKVFPSNEEVRGIYGLLETFKDKSMFLLMYQSGINEKDVGEINIEDLPKLENPPCYWRWVRAKTREEVQTCIGEDAAHDLKSYLDTIDRDEGALYLTREKNRLSTRLIRETLKPYFERAKIKAQIKSLRDAYSDALDHANIKADLKKKMMGHAPPGAAKHYETSEYTIIEAYNKAYKYLSINEVRRSREQPWREIDELRVNDAVEHIRALELKFPGIVEHYKELYGSVSTDFAGEGFAPSDVIFARAISRL